MVTDEHKIKPLTSAGEWEAAWPVLHQLRTELSLETFLARRELLLAGGYQLFGLTIDEKIISLAGLIIYPRLDAAECWVYDLVTAESQRSKGYGKELLNFVSAHAQTAGCKNICLHTRLFRSDAQRFYEESAAWDKYAFVYKKSF